KYQREFEKIAHKFLKNINKLHESALSTKSNPSRKLSSPSTPPPSSSTPSATTQSIRSIQQQIERCHNLWIKSLEYLAILQKHKGKRCPRHFGRNNNNKLLERFDDLSSSSPSSSSSTSPPVSTIDQTRPESLQSINNQSKTLRNNRPIELNRLERFDRLSPPPSSSTSLTSLLLATSELRKRSDPQNHLEKRRSIAIGESSVLIVNRRIQTTSKFCQNYPLNYHSLSTTMIEQQSDSLICDTHSLDGSGSPGADSGVFSSFIDSNKYEIIQKDIGYSSDADLSDAIEAQPKSQRNTSSSNFKQNSSQRKRQVRRRRTRTSRNRPWSFHANWTDWDYYQTPLGSGENFHNIDLDDDDNENKVRELTEFGENYESWIKTESDIDTDNQAIVIEKPEIESLGCDASIVERHEIGVSTSPIPIDEMIVGKNFANKSTQTDGVEMSEASCMTTATNSSSIIASSITTTTAATTAIVGPIFKSNRKDREEKSNETIESLFKSKSIESSSSSSSSSLNRLEDKRNISETGTNCLLDQIDCDQSKKLSATKAKQTQSSSSSTSIPASQSSPSSSSSSSSSSYSSIKLYTSIALAGLISFLIAVTQFSPEIHKSYSRPPPL
ncbi:hypothetical protein SSS_05432, partial [Sarcoptes scabiei]